MRSRHAWSRLFLVDPPHIADALPRAIDRPSRQNHGDDVKCLLDASLTVGFAKYGRERASDLQQP